MTDQDKTNPLIGNLHAVDGTLRISEADYSDNILSPTFVAVRIIVSVCLTT